MDNNLRALPRVDHTGGFKASQYRPALGREICARVAEGRTIAEIVADPAMPSRATLFHWLKGQPMFALAYAAVRHDRARSRIAAADTRRAAQAAVRASAARAAGRRPRDWVSGQKSRYSREAARRFCEAIAEGASLAQATARPGMPSVKQVYGWLKRHTEFRDLYAEARERQRFGLEVTIDLIVMSANPLQVEVAQDRVRRLEARIGRLTPRVWRSPPAPPWL